MDGKIEVPQSVIDKLSDKDKLQVSFLYYVLTKLSALVSDDIRSYMNSLNNSTPYTDIDKQQRQRYFDTCVFILNDLIKKYPKIPFFLTKKAHHLFRFGFTQEHALEAKKIIDQSVKKNTIDELLLCTYVDFYKPHKSITHLKKFVTDNKNKIADRNTYNNLIELIDKEKQRRDEEVAHTHTNTIYDMHSVLAELKYNYEQFMISNEDLEKNQLETVKTLIEKIYAEIKQYLHAKRKHLDKHVIDDIRKSSTFLVVGIIPVSKKDLLSASTSAKEHLEYLDTQEHIGYSSLDYHKKIHVYLTLLTLPIKKREAFLEESKAILSEFDYGDILRKLSYTNIS